MTAGLSYKFQMWTLPVIAYWMLIIGTQNGHSWKNSFPTNPEVNMNLSQMMSYRGYPNEYYDIVTEDGYFLKLLRIPKGKENLGTVPHRPVVYLQHGFAASAFNWVANLPSNSLAYLLADAGCDVWLGNSRGNTWSRRHMALSPDSEEFWAFSFDEMAKYDLPATLNFILKKTKQKELYYLGHSQGTTIAFISFSTNPKLAQKIKMFFGLAPVVSVKHIKDPPKELLPLLKSLLKTRLDVYISNFSGVSVQNAIHWIQLISSEQFHAYDWEDPALNMLHYHQATPPLYNVTLMTVPTMLWSGGEDALADPIDVDSLLPNISNLISHKRIPEYNHLDFYLGMDIAQQVYYEVIKVIKKNMQT
ncbi:lipase member K-like isoform X2 [Macrotis lagotis]|uniref:lipase member K-like isoform X2 n=1 Tax=Macrotis lagotis TaxID=92651 RepID=UPI003D687E3B